MQLCVFSNIAQILTRDTLRIIISPYSYTVVRVQTTHFDAISASQVGVMVSYTLSHACNNCHTFIPP